MILKKISSFIFGIFISFTAGTTLHADILDDKSLYANLSMNAYTDDLYKLLRVPGVRIGNQADFTVDGKSVRVAGHVSNGSYGFQAIAFEVDGKVVVSFRGTDLSQPTDIVTDIWSLWKTNKKRVSKQYSEAISFMEKITKAYPNTNIEVTGHSLGGSIAQYVGVIYDKPTVTFNSAPIFSDSFEFYRLSNSEISRRSKDIINIRQVDDPVSYSLGGVTNSVGENLFVNTQYAKDCGSFSCRHSIKAFQGEPYILKDYNPTYGQGSLNNQASSILPDFLNTQYNFTNIGPYNTPYITPYKTPLNTPLNSYYSFPGSTLPVYGSPNGLSEYSASYRENSLPSHFSVNLNTDLADERIVALAASKDPAIPIKPEEVTFPTAEEIAEANRLAEEQRLAAIASLRQQRNSYSLTQQDATARLQERRNRLTILEFDELEQVHQASTRNRNEIADLRAEQNSTGLSTANQQRLLDLVRYEDRLQTEQERIARDIESARNAISTYQAALNQANAQLSNNAVSLANLGDNLSNYTVPNFTPEGLTDWSTYVYVLPPFNGTDVPTSDILNVVVSTVSLPVTSGTIRKTGDLVSEDGNTIRYSFWGVDKARSQKLEGFNHIFYGVGSGGLQWIYGEATTPEQFALRSGTAVFNGGMSGYYAHGNQNSNVVYADSVEGGLNLNIDFATSRLTGGGLFKINNEARRENLSFSLNESTITGTNNLTRSLGFNTNATLGNGAVGNGNFSGTFYGADASEAAGSFAFNLQGGFAAGLWAAGENYIPNQEDTSIGRITTSKSTGLSRSIYDTEIYSGDGVGPGSDTFTDVLVDQESGGGEVRLVNKFNAGNPSDPYQYTSWGNWVANSKTTANFSEGGYFVEAEMRTPSSVVQNKTGTASYSGDIVGDYVSNGAREDATGKINLTADFSTDLIQGQMQFGHGSTGTNAGGTVSPVANLSGMPIDNNGTFEQNAGSFGVSGFFTGPDAEEMGGTAWMHVDDGSYNGVFRAKQ